MIFRKAGITIRAFEMPVLLYAGENAFRRAISRLLQKQNAKRVLYFTGSRGLKTVPSFPERESLTEAVFPVKGEPDVQMVQEALRFTGDFRPDVIISIGGGSVIDLAKAVSFLAGDENDIYYYYDHPNVLKETIPHIAVPTTCGTGAEVTANAVIRREDRKQSIRSASLRPYAALIDPFFTEALPLNVLIHSALDSLTQLIESFVSNQANLLTDGICREGLRLFQKGFQVDRLSSLSAEERLDLQTAALLSGIALSNSRLGIVHGVASVLGGRTSMGHGEICARFLRPFTGKNIEKAKAEDEGLLEKYREVACILGNRPDLSADDLPRILGNYENTLAKTKLTPLSFSEREGEEIAEASLAASSTQGNPFRFTKEEVIEVFSSVQQS